MNVTFTPGAAHGTVAAPPSKSMAHRLLICAGLAEGSSIVRGVAPSEDVTATVDCLRALGAKVTVIGDEAQVTGVRPSLRKEEALFPCRESGSTLRFFIPLALLSDKPASFAGSKRLFERPLSVYEDLCRAQSLSFDRTPDGLTVCGRLHSGSFTVPGNISSQFISGLLFALPSLRADSVVRVTQPVESRAYIDMTVASLAAFGVTVVEKEPNTFFVRGNRPFEPRVLAVEGDWSNAAFLLALNLLDGDVQVTGLDENSLQGDRVCREGFAALRLGAPTVDVSGCPDLAPVYFTAAAFLHGARFTGTARLADKESDRAAVMKEELAKCGVPCEMTADTFTVPAVTPLAPATPFDSHNDHRIAMALSLAASRLGGTVAHAEAVKKSFPDFFEKLAALGVTFQTA